VTVKIRSGWDEENINAPEIARRVEDAGAAVLAVHARTRSQRFEGRANWSVIRDVVQAVKMPVIGNGDVISGREAGRMLAETGCAAVLVGRGSLGRPWIFKQINHYLATGEELPEPDLRERVAVIRQHYEGLKAQKGERTGRLEMRKHTAWYLKSVNGAAEIRRRVNTAETETAFLDILSELESGLFSFQPVA
jgi:nifR3 family TIM-barrel protein